MTSTTMDPKALLAQMSPEEIRAFYQEVGGVLKDAEQQRREEYGVLGAEFLAHVAKTSPAIFSESSDWVGTRDSGIPFTHDGREYVAQVILTDVTTKLTRVETTAEIAKTDPRRYFAKKAPAKKARA